MESLRNTIAGLNPEEIKQKLKKLGLKKRDKVAD